MLEETSREGTSTKDTLIKTKQTPYINLLTIAGIIWFLMPMLGLEGMPFFIGTNITEFIKQLKELCKDY